MDEIINYIGLTFQITGLFFVSYDLLWSYKKRLKIDPSFDEIKTINIWLGDKAIESIYSDNPRECDKYQNDKQKSTINDKSKTLLESIEMKIRKIELDNAKKYLLHGLLGLIPIALSI